MNYPVWDIPVLGGQVLIALISVTHVFVAHFAVGGGLFIWLTDWKGVREKDPEIHDYVRKHTWFFLLLTMVFGGVSGVGIWFIIGLVHPSGTSILIHNYVFGWAVEWVFFLGEIIALLIYHYTFERLKPHQRLLMAFLYFLFAWLSLFVINGIIAFMLTPGRWLETRDFWHGFFNPSFFPSLLFRTFTATMLAGMFAYVTVVFLQAGPFRLKMMRYSTKWMLLSYIGLIPSAAWYFYAIPAEARITAFSLNSETIPFLITFLVTSGIIVLFGLFFTLKVAPGIQKVLVFLLIGIGLAWIGGFEYMREIARKPWIIYNHMYSNSILREDMKRLNGEGTLQNAKWSLIRTVGSHNRIQTGKELFKVQCMICHTVNGLYNDIVKHTEGLTTLGMTAQLRGQGKIRSYMPPFAGKESEREALAEYIVSGLHNRNVETKKPFQFVEQSFEMPPYDSDHDQYILLAWNALGMHCLSDRDRWFGILPPAGTLEAQLIKRGPTPEMIRDGVKMTYKVEKGFENPSAHVDFWDYAEKVYGARIEKNKGLTGNGLEGVMVYDETRKAFVAAKIPVTPYRQFGQETVYNPYPLFTIEARDLETGKVLVETKVVGSTSTEMGCRNCHGGDWGWKGISGLSEETASRILKVHDRISGTDLYKRAGEGEPLLCQGCHPDPALNTKGREGALNFSAAMHGWHAVYMTGMKEDACMLCHPASPEGNTRCSRDIHNRVGITCVNCHGTMEDHALALLLGEKDKPSARAIITHLQPQADRGKEGIRPRRPWINEPDCLHCHRDFQKPGPDPSAFNQWVQGPEALYRVRTDDSGSIRCEACHGATHALYPSQNPLNPDRDNIQPLQYSGMPYPIGSNKSCKVCHMDDMEEGIHHKNMERMVRHKVTPP